MIEISADDRLEILVEGNVAPDGSPKTGTVSWDDSHRLAVLVEDIDRKVKILAVLDVLVLSLEAVLKLDVLDIGAEVADLLTIRVDGVGFLDVL